VVKGVVQGSPADRLTIAKLLKPGDILVSVNGNSVLRTVAEKSSRHLFGPTEFSMELVVFSPDNQTREENSVLMEQLEKQHADARKDKPYMRRNAKKAASRQVRAEDAGHIGWRFVDPKDNKTYEITDVYYDINEDLLCFDHVACDEDDDRTHVAGFAEMRSWGIREWQTPESHLSDQQRSDYERLREARIQANQEFLRHLGLA